MQLRPNVASSSFAGMGVVDAGLTAVIAGLLAVVACEEPSPSPPPPAGTRPPAETTMIPALPRTASTDSLPARIYYNLSRHEWYAHGEPLHWDDRDWDMSGGPVPLETEAMTLVGEYQGVDVYVVTAEDSAGSVALVYVPVSEGFWLPFEPVRREDP